MSIDTAYLESCLDTLETGLVQLKQTDPKDGQYRVYRAACIKEFEIVIEQCAKLLRKRLGAYFVSKQERDRLTVKDLFRHAAKHGLMDSEAVERWFAYREQRNKTAHEYGERYAETALEYLPSFIKDAHTLIATVKEVEDD